MRKELIGLSKKIKERIVRDTTRSRFSYTSLSSQEAAQIINSFGTSASVRPYAENKTNTWIEPTSPFKLTGTVVALYNCEEGEGTTTADRSDNGNDLSLIGATWSSNAKFGDYALSFNGSAKATVTITSQEPISSYLFVAAWGDGQGTIFEWPNVFVLETDGSNLIATINGEQFVGPETGSGYECYACQFSAGTVIIAVNDIAMTFSASTTQLQAQAVSSGRTYPYFVNANLSNNIGIESFGEEEIVTTWGNGWVGELDEMCIDANARIEEDWPSYPILGFPQDLCRYRFADKTGSIAYSSKPMESVMNLYNYTWVDGKNGYAIEFNGSSTYGQVSLQQQTTSIITIELIAKFDNNASEQVLLDQVDGINLTYDGDGIFAALDGVTNPSTRIIDWIPSTDVWYMISLVYDGSYKYIYINGQLYGQLEAEGTMSITDSLIVGKSVSNDKYFDGKLDFLSVTRARIRPYKRPINRMLVGLHGFDNPEWIL